MTDAALIRCSACGAKNRVPRSRLNEGWQPVCGRCKAALPVAADTAPVIVTDVNFSTEVEHSPVPVLVDMWAPWCGPCRSLSPVIDAVAKEMAGRIRVAKMNVDENPQTASRFRVLSIPTLLMVKGGKEVDRLVGVHPKTEIIRRLERVLT